MALRSLGGLGGGNASGAGGRGASLARMRFSALMRGDSGKRSAAIVSFSSATSTARSSSVSELALATIFLLLRKEGVT